MSDEWLKYVWARYGRVQAVRREGPLAELTFLGT